MDLTVVDLLVLAGVFLLLTFHVRQHIAWPRLARSGPSVAEQAAQSSAAPSENSAPARTSAQTRQPNAATGQRSELQRFTDEAVRENRPFAVVLVEVAASAPIPAAADFQELFTAIETALVSTLPTHHHLRVANELIIVAPAPSPALPAAVLAVTNLVARISSYRYASLASLVSVGSASFPESGETLAALVVAARASARPLTLGGPAIIRAESRATVVTTESERVGSTRK